MVKMIWTCIEEATDFDCENVRSMSIDGKRKKEHPTRKCKYNVSQDIKELAFFNDTTLNMSVCGG